MQGGGEVSMPRTTVLLVLVALLAACAEPENPADDEVLVRVDTVFLDQRNAPVVLLQEEHGPRALPIWIGTAEASSIASQINNQQPPRPNFHDLAQRVIQKLDAEVERVVVTELRGGTYYGVLTLRSGGRRIDIDVRPSDGIAVALRTRAPILVRASVFEAAGQEVASEGEEREI
jgi:bifunctional DNase/RNase